MRAIAYRKHGDISVLEEVLLPKPKVKDQHLLVRVRAFGLNPLDYRLRRGELKVITGMRGTKLIGSDFAGVVESVGPNVHGFSVGDAVFGMTFQPLAGCSAQWIAVPAKQVARMPSLPFEVGAAVPLAALTAYQALTDLVSVEYGCHVLINGASGGVGTFAVQIARLYGATVTAVTSFRNQSWMSDLGAHRTVDYTKSDFAREKHAFDVIFDCYGNRTFEDCRRALKPNGTYISTIPALSRYRSVMFNSVRKKQSKVVVVRARGSQLQTIASLIDAGELEPIVEKTYPFERIKDAYAHLESKRTKGKLTVTVD